MVKNFYFGYSTVQNREKIFFFSANVRQCNIAYSTVHVKLCLLKIFFMVLLFFFSFQFHWHKPTGSINTLY